MVTGGRDFEDLDLARAALGQVASVGSILIAGGARGADEAARRIWHYEFQLPYVVHPAPWERVGKGAGYRRNGAMVRGTSLSPWYLGLKPTVVVAFPGGRGTAHAVETARKNNIWVISAEDLATRKDNS